MKLEDILEMPRSSCPVKEIVKAQFMDRLAKQKRAVLFGAGSGGIRVYEFIQKNIPGGGNLVKCFVDNNPRKHYTELADKRILPPHEVFAEYDEELVVISCGEGDEIIQQLAELGIPEEKVFIPDLAAASENGAEFILQNISLLGRIYDGLADEKSRHVFQNILNYRLSHKMELIKEIADDSRDQYFDRQLIRYSSSDVFLDCGGYIGDTIEAYIYHNHGAYAKIICLEADADNATIIEQRMIKEKGCKVELHHAAAYHKKAELEFDRIGSGSGRIIEDGCAKTESVLVKAETIDSILKGRKVDFIKMDIEGAEYKALLGAVDTIQIYKPTLMICVYPRQDDFISIPMLIKSMNCNYKLYLRHYRSLSVQETVLYAVNSMQI